MINDNTLLPGVPVVPADRPSRAAARGGRGREPVRLPLVDQYIGKQKTLTAVERFAQRHAAEEPQSRFYEDLIPAKTPGPGEQYAFRVDLDVCTGCKACVTACHHLNGLEPDEAWRSVGLLHGGTSVEPMQQTVTTACHHCIDPACMNGCPVKAYEKDSITGIVKHLDDQCIGCQYCILTCPYEVPQFNASRGIVRKCDMCSDRLAHGEAPACVQACPNEAISIQLVERARVLEDAQGGYFLPGAPSPAITVPSTQYVTKKAFPRNLLPADFYRVRTGHQHLPLVFMLVLTQLSVGAFAVDFSLAFFGRYVGLDGVRPYHAAVSLVVGFLALAASVFHLGRPQYAFRAIVGIKTSWLSREILAFGAFAGLAALHAGLFWARGLGLPWSNALAPAEHALAGLALQKLLGGLVAASGAAGVACSVMLYRATAREWWSGGRTTIRFFGTAAVLGLATMLMTLAAFSGLLGTEAAPNAMHTIGLLARALVLAGGAKLVWELGIFQHLRDKQLGPMKRTALLLSGELGREMGARTVLGAVGGLIAPLIIGALAAAPARPAGLLVVLSSIAWLFLLAAELLERALFFRASCAPRMPGGVG